MYRKESKAADRVLDRKERNGDVSRLQGRALLEIPRALFSPFVRINNERLCSSNDTATLDAQIFEIV